MAQRDLLPLLGALLILSGCTAPALVGIFSDSTIPITLTGQVKNADGSPYQGKVQLYRFDDSATDPIEASSTPFQATQADASGNFTFSFDNKDVLKPGSDFHTRYFSLYASLEDGKTVRETLDIQTPNIHLAPLQFWDPTDLSNPTVNQANYSFKWPNDAGTSKYGVRIENDDSVLWESGLSSTTDTELPLSLFANTGNARWCAMRDSGGVVACSKPMPLAFPTDKNNPVLSVAGVTDSLQQDLGAMIDGKLDTGAVFTRNSSESNGDWIQLDLGSVKKLAGIAFRNVFAGGPVPVLYLSNTGDEWAKSTDPFLWTNLKPITLSGIPTTGGDGTGKSRYVYVDLDGQTARYLRLIVSDCGSFGCGDIWGTPESLQINEISVFGVSSGVATATSTAAPGDVASSPRPSASAPTAPLLTRTLSDFSFSYPSNWIPNDSIVENASPDPEWSTLAFFDRGKTGDIGAGLTITKTSTPVSLETVVDAWSNGIGSDLLGLEKTTIAGEPAYDGTRKLSDHTLIDDTFISHGGYVYQFSMHYLPLRSDSFTIVSEGIQIVNSIKWAVAP